MKRFIPLTQLFDRITNKRFEIWLDKLKFVHIFVIWISIIIIFGLVYHFFGGNSSFLIYTTDKAHVDWIVDKIFFSFMIASSSGFGYMAPIGFFRIVTIFEVVCGLILLALVTSKLVSIKQDIILSEIYEISFNEKINRMRSSLLLFRQNLSKIIDRVEDNVIRKREVNDIYIYISSLEDILNEIISLVGTSGRHYFKKVIDPLNTELLFNSVLSSFERLNELITILNQTKLEWKRDVTLNLIERSISLNDALFARLNSSKNLPDKIINDLTAQKNTVISSIKQGLSHSQSPKQ